MNRRPIHTVRSDWTLIDAPDVLDALGSAYLVAAERNTHDGRLTVIVADEPPIGWHLSISHRDHRGEPRRYPSWDEIADARDVFLPADLTFAMLLPPADQYVAVHATTFHLHEHPTPATRSQLVRCAMAAIDPAPAPVSLDAPVAIVAGLVVDRLVAAGHLRPARARS